LFIKFFEEGFLTNRKLFPLITEISPEKPFFKYEYLTKSTILSDILEKENISQRPKFSENSSIFAFICLKDFQKVKTSLFKL
jgi:hypothetical protein